MGRQLARRPAPRPSGTRRPRSWAPSTTRPGRDLARASARSPAPSPRPRTACPCRPAERARGAAFRALSRSRGRCRSGTGPASGGRGRSSWSALQDLAHAGVQLLHHVAVGATPRGAGKGRGGVQRHVRQVVREVEEEGPAARAADDRERLARVPSGDLAGGQRLARRPVVLARVCGDRCRRGCRSSGRSRGAGAGTAARRRGATSPPWP